jgi:hypothetical protein
MMLADKLRDDLRSTPTTSEPNVELQYAAEAFRASLWRA